MVIIIALTALIATILGSISGIGGGVLIKPVMDAIVSDLTTSEISFLSGTTVLAMTTVSLLRSRKGTVKIDKRGTFLALGGAIGGLIGKAIFDLAVSAIPDSRVSLVQNIIMVALTLLVFIYTLLKARIHTLSIQNRGFCLFAGLFLGVVSSFLGIGGGPINLMFLSFFFSMDSKTAALSSLYIIFFSQAVSLISNVVTGSIPSVDYLTLLVMILMGITGATIGRGVSKRLSNRGVDILFMCLLVVIIGISIYNVVRYS